MAKDTFVLLGGVHSLEFSVFVPMLERGGFRILSLDDPALPQVPSVGEWFVDARISPTRTSDALVRLEPERDRIAGVFNVSEAFVETGALVCEWLKLPGPGLLAARVARNKLLQRCFLPELAPRFRPFRLTDGLPPFEHYPAVVKALDRHGGSGIRLLASPRALEEVRANYASDEALVLEEFVDGMDFSIETLVHEGRIVFANITEEADAPSGLEHLELGYTMPAPRLSGPRAEHAYAVNRGVVERLELRSGVMHAEYKARGDRIFLIELAVRVPGDGLLAMYECSTGVPLEQAILDIALGRDPSYPKLARVSRQIFFEGPEEPLLGAEFEGLALTPRFPGMPRASQVSPDPPWHGIRELRLCQARLQRLQQVRQASDRHGAVLFDASSFDELAERERFIRKNLFVLTERGRVHAEFY